MNLTDERLAELREKWSMHPLQGSVVRELIKARDQLAAERARVAQLAQALRTIRSQSKECVSFHLDCRFVESIANEALAAEPSPVLAVIAAARKLSEDITDMLVMDEEREALAKLRAALAAHDGEGES